MGPIPWLIMSEILPVKIKGLGGSVATLCNWLCSWIVTLTAPMLLTWISGGTFTIMHGRLCFGCGICGNVGARDQRQNPGGDSVFSQMKVVVFFDFSCSEFLLIFCLFLFFRTFHSCNLILIVDTIEESWRMFSAQRTAPAIGTPKCSSYIAGIFGAKAATCSIHYTKTQA